MKLIDKMSQRELRNELRTTRKLLAEATCPNEGCSSGVIDLRNYNYEKCQWCAERSELIGNG